MTKLRLEFKKLVFDYYAMGVNAYVPLGAGILLVVSLGVIRMTNGVVGLDNIIRSFEYVAAPLAAWWSIFLMERIVTLPGCEVYFALPVSRLYLGVVRAARGWLLYELFTLALLAAALAWMSDIAFLFPLWLQMAAEGLFFAGLGLLTVCLTRSVNYSIVVIVAYVLVNAFFKGNVLALINVFQFNADSIPVNEYLLAGGIKTLLLSCLAGYAAHVALSHIPPKS